jgi:hypothetical protein
MATEDMEPTAPEAATGREALRKGVVVTLTGATVVTGGGLLALGSAITAGAQSAPVAHAGPGIEQVEQDADVLNGGLALANSGVNGAVGNNSVNVVGTDQVPVDGINMLSAASNGGGGGGVAQLTGTATNSSDGTASVSTGAATATGNSAETSVSQSAVAAVAGTPGIAIVEQGADVANIGIGIANSGLNGAVGNNSGNSAGVVQTAGGGGTKSVTGTATNSSDGTASVTTGAATATGNRSTVSITQG